MKSIAAVTLLFFLFPIKSVRATIVNCPSLMNKTYFAKVMDSSFFYDDFEEQVLFLTEQEKTYFKVCFENGLLVDWEGKAINTDLESHWMFVMSETGEIYLQTKKAMKMVSRIGRYHHSSFLSGGRVAMAGGLKVKDGLLLEMDNGSGHYSPFPFMMSQAVAQLKANGVNLSKTRIIDYKNKVQKLVEMTDENIVELTIHNLKTSFGLAGTDLATAGMKLSEVLPLLQSQHEKVKFFAGRLIIKLLPFEELASVFTSTSDKEIQSGILSGFAELDSKKLDKFLVSKLLDIATQSDFPEVRERAARLVSMGSFPRSDGFKLLAGARTQYEFLSYLKMISSLLRDKSLQAENALLLVLESKTLVPLQNPTDFDEVSIISGFGDILRNYYQNNPRTHHILRRLGERLRDIAANSKEKSDAKFEANRLLYNWEKR